MASKTSNARSTLLERLRSAPPAETSFALATDAELLDAYEQALSDERIATLVADTASGPAAETLANAASEAAEKVAKTRAAVQADAIIFRFRGLPRDAFNALMLEHPPTEEQVRKRKEQGQPPADYNPDSFQTALIAATCVEPGFDSEDEAAQVLAELSLTEAQAMFNAALAACTRSRVVEAKNR